MRLAITGKTRSGKSTALHNLLSHALAQPWAGVLLLDGKGSELRHYADLPLDYCGADQIGLWAQRLEDHAAAMAARYTALIDRGLRAAAPGDPRYLIVIDEVQKATRDKKHGTAVKNALTLIFEQSAALGDVLIVSSQREINAIPPSVRHNINIWLRMLGAGYFYLQPDGQATSSGRTKLLTPHQARAIIAGDSQPLPFIPCHLPAILGAQPVLPGRATVTLYLGEAGSGRTWHLQHHPRRQTRTIYVDLNQPHKQALSQIILQAGAALPHRCTMVDLVEIASLAVQAESTLLLLDNLDQASVKMIPDVHRLIQAAGEVALAAAAARTAVEHRKIDSFLARAKIVEIRPLSRSAALDLIHLHLPAAVADPLATQRRILELAQGHPATIVRLATQTERGNLAEVREYQAGRQETVSLGWLLVVPALFLLLLWRTDGYMVAAAAILGIMILRRVALRMIT